MGNKSTVSLVKTGMADIQKLALVEIEVQHTVSATLGEHMVFPPFRAHILTMSI